MELQKNYRLVWLGETPYILPFGQAAANLRRGVRINSSGAFLWNALQGGASQEELLEQMIAEYQPGKEDIPLLKEDIENFLKKLDAYGILSPDSHTAVPFRQHITRTLAIGGITIAYQGPEGLFSPEFEPFCIENVWEEDTGGSSEAAGCARHVAAVPETDLQLTIADGMPSCFPEGQILARNSELTIGSSGEDYFCIYPRKDGLVEWHLTKDGAQAVLYCREPFPEDTAQEIFHAVRMIYLVLAQRKGLFAIHSASLLYKGRAWLFSGRSGAGKSTHTALWKEMFRTPLLNGDLNLLQLNGDGAIVHGMPWCGTSGISVSGSYPLGGIVFVKRHVKDEVLELPPDEQALSVLQRLISPTWTEEMFSRNLEFAEELVRRIPVFRLLCTKEPSAAAAMKAAIDRI